MAMKAEIKTL